MGITIERSSLLDLEKGNQESVQEYVYGGEKMLLKLTHLYLKRKWLIFFSNTFNEPYFVHLLGAPAKHFIDIVIVVKRIEQAIRTNKIIDKKKRGGLGRKKDNEVHWLGSNQHQPRKWWNNKWKSKRQKDSLYV